METTAHGPRELSCSPLYRLAYNDIDSEGAEAFAPALAANASLTDLKLEYNGLQDEGVTAVCKGIQSNKDTKLASLNISRNGVGPEGAKSVAAMVAVTASLTKIDVRLNALGDDGKAALRKAVEGRSGFQLML